MEHLATLAPQLRALPIGGGIGFAPMAFAAILAILIAALEGCEGKGGRLEGLARPAAAERDYDMAVDGQILDSASGRPVSGAVVRLARESDGEIAAETVTDDAGAFRFESVAPGSYTLVVGRENYWVLTDVIEIAWGSNTIEMNLEPAPPVAKRGTGLPAATGVSASATPPGGIAAPTAVETPAPVTMEITVNPTPAAATAESVPVVPPVAGPVAPTSPPAEPPAPPPVVAREETCNGRDDDLDGAIDETFISKGNACRSGLGVCERAGVLICRTDGMGVECTAAVGAAVPEVCGDGIDNDCNGVADDLAACPLPVTPTSLVAVTDGWEVRLAWLPGEGEEDGFVIERAESEAAFAPVASVGHGEAMFTDQGVEDAATYRYRVYAVNTNGRSPESPEIVVHTPPAPRAERLAAGKYHTLAVHGGALYAWGDNRYGQLGDGTRANRGTPGRIGEESDWAAVSGGYFHSCGIRRNGSLWCWGYNLFGQLGDGSTETRLAPVRIGEATDWEKIEAGDRHTCGIRSGGSLWCWGGNAYGQLGTGSRGGELMPARAGAASVWRGVATGANHTCALSREGEVWCWGYNAFGQLGTGSRVDALEPARVGTERDWAVVATGWNHSCALKTDRSLWCWGADDFGQIIGGGGAPILTPTRIEAEGEWIRVATGQNHTCAIRSRSSVLCWGDNASGQLGVAEPQQTSTPTPVTGAPPTRTITTGVFHTCAGPSEASPVCWGLNAFGQLGDGTTTDRYTPVRVGVAEDEGR
ncbi:MAG: carboxypeptidase regulatory-like domain-containing protein [Nitrospirae bacterium]|nr:carboxypeptidase regulatory-like domain-containing protein [Nitrospirota bacterium]